MSEKNEAGLNGLDMQAVLVSWIVAHDCCGDINCKGDRGIFKGVECPVRCPQHAISSKKRVSKAKEWLREYHQQKTEAAEAEKRKVEAAKKEERKAKQETARICGNCKHIHEVEKSENMIAHCDMKKNMVPVLFDLCPDFKPREKAKSDDENECHADAMIYNGIRISTPSQEDKLRHKVWLLEIENSQRLNDIERLKAEAAKLTAEDAERISQLEKENKRLAEEVGGYRGVARRISELCEVIVIDIDKAIKEREELQNQLNLAKDDALRLGKENADLAAKCERLTEQRNKLSGDLIQATLRLKYRIESEREAGKIKKEWAANRHRWNEMHCKIVQLKEENAKLQGLNENLKHSACWGIEGSLCRINELEKESADLRNGNKALSETIVQMSGRIKHLEEQLSESK